ncbi:LPS export ABC transporter permease LptF [Litoribrevibacter albus]|uniref:Lipopolysaccharide export system permease protein LptF n=1 Tax=Litoribrevibacter albus TaxID=1473156 RepID=A0AA37SA37_9GAMM|nr:LPS export ABC transporter permease LptF [Litoribrevibacter albus]GLQ32092.1 LPS export ABC transporter permease LptF [Litoribrevibacter albus]
MIIFKYLARQVIVNMLAIISILLMIIVSARLVKYFRYIAEGTLAPEFLLLFIGYRIPGFLELIVPLAFFLSLLLAYGRMYLDSEMAVLSSCGMSRQHLLRYTLGVSVIAFTMVASMTLGLTAWGEREVQNIKDQQKSMHVLDFISERSFSVIKKAGVVVYAGDMTDDKSRMYDIFASRSVPGQEDMRDVIVAESGYQQTSANGERLLILEHGQRVMLIPGQLEADVVDFEELHVRLPRSVVVKRKDVEGMDVSELWQQDNPDARAYLHWRLALPFMLPILALLAVPLSEINPRDGQVKRFVPAIIIILGYAGLMIWARDNIEKDKLHPVVMWSVHLVFIALAVFLNRQIWKDKAIMAAQMTVQNKGASSGTSKGGAA